jgi:hypothetical protein
MATLCLPVSIVIQVLLDHNLPFLVNEDHHSGGF